MIDTSQDQQLVKWKTNVKGEHSYMHRVIILMEIKQLPKDSH